MALLDTRPTRSHLTPACAWEQPDAKAWATYDRWCLLVVASEPAPIGRRLVRRQALSTPSGSWRVRGVLSPPAGKPELGGDETSSAAVQLHTSLYHETGVLAGGHHVDASIGSVG